MERILQSFIFFCSSFLSHIPQSPPPIRIRAGRPSIHIHTHTHTTYSTFMWLVPTCYIALHWGIFRFYRETNFLLSNKQAARVFHQLHWREWRWRHRAKASYSKLIKRRNRLKVHVRCASEKREIRFINLDRIELGFGVLIGHFWTTHTQSHFTMTSNDCSLFKLDAVDAIV